MEITDEIKTKVFAQYLGQPFNMILNDGSFKLGICSLGTIQLLNKKDVLILKPLSAITDEDAIEVAKILYKDGDDYRISFNNGDIITIAPFGLPHYGDEIDIHPKSNHFFADRGEYKGQYLAYQYLISKGYDLPNFLLDGKTLKEAELAIYEN